MTAPIHNEHSRWYHCFCCYPTTNSVDSGSKSVDPIPQSNGGHWANGKFQEGGPLPAKDEFKKEFEGK